MAGQADVTYTTTDSGFCYRILKTKLSDGYAAAMAELREGEKLFRMHYVGGNPWPALIDGGEAEFNECFERWPNIELAAGIPAPRK